MKQSSNKKSREATAFLYERLSRDDNLEGESYSIGNQKKLLTKVAKEKGYTNLVHFLDDGISGVTMNRPGFVEMMQQLEQGKASAVFVKDLSRLGRNYIEVGRLTEEFFPDHDIRLVAVSDNIDTAEGENELAPIRNLFNEWYARDISKKRRISNKIKGNAGEPMGLPPYGYIKDPNNPKHWVIDEEAAQVVRRIFDMTLEGFGTEQIATQFEKEGILTPQTYWIQKGIGRPGKTKTRPATKWNGSTITHLLYQQEYCGDVLNFKTYSKSYKNKKRIHNDPENWVVFQNVHEPIIERAVFEQVQQKRGKMRKRRTSNGEHNMFSGLLVCADCGCNLHFHFNQGNPEIKYFNCSNYKGNRGTCQSTHYIRVDFLEEVVLGEIRRLTKFASLYEDDFLKAVIGHSQQADEADRKLKEKELKALLARDEELDGLFERIYEDNVSGKISDERFSRMSRRYEDEQKELTEKIKQLRSEIEKQSSRTMTTDMFISLVRKYTRAKKLTPRMLNELVEKIEVFNAEKVNGVWEQRLRIHYNCVGTIEIPSALPLPTPDVSVNTRKGVVVNYAPCDVAI
ncbi:recombinase family protein [Faecalibacterium sp. Marseille-P9590]|uniref:recombinase family protein n=1 Tax=Faecalibacterium sp. Marseille-P9590 TaxID=2817017 RepID=UPI001F6158E2|nr:recombinase family protein [Faecalibacterium sp. Marseille-P9590]